MPRPKNDKDSPATGARRRRAPKPTNLVTDTAPPAASESGDAPASRSLSATQGKELTTSDWIKIYLGIFVVVQVVIVLAFGFIGGDSRLIRKMLDEAEALKNKGETEKALVVLDEFSQKFPGAMETQNFRRRLGEYHLANGDYEEALKYLESSLQAEELRPDLIRDTRALAGEAAWLSGQTEKAVALFQEELKSGNPNNDKANYYLGMNELENGTSMKAFEYFQAIQNPDQYKDELEQAQKLAEETIFKPARDAAKAALAGS